MTIGHFAIQELRGVHRREDGNVAKQRTIEIVALRLILSFVRTTFDPSSSSLF